MDLPKRKSPRIPGYDYATPGEYFVTICTENSAKLLGEVQNGKMLLSPVGMICKEELEKLHLTDYTIMPNHVHLVISLSEPARPLANVVGAWKSITTKRINALCGTPGRHIWQRSYHDHAIRCDFDRTEILRYIEENPLKWELDRLHID